MEGHIYHVLASYLRTVNAAIWRAGVRWGGGSGGGGGLTWANSTGCKREKDKKKETQWEKTPRGCQWVINEVSAGGEEVRAGWITSLSFFDASCQ